MNWFNHITFANPEWLWALFAVPVLLILLFVRKQDGEVRHPSSGLLQGFTWAGIRPLLSVLSILALGCWIVAFARPQSTKVDRYVQGGEGIDIILAVDISQSMLAIDFKPNRLEALKEVAAEFVENRPNDRIGLVVYGGEAYTQIPLTTDEDVLISGIADLHTGVISKSTAIGMGLATAANRINESDAKSKVIILMTDGENNAGSITPRAASALAAELGVRVYTIGIGSNGMTKIPETIRGRTVYQNFQGRLDEELLKDIASQTGGRYYRALNKDQLGEIYGEIDRLEKTKIEEFKYTQYNEHFYPWAITGLGLLALEFLLRNSLFRSAL